MIVQANVYQLDERRLLLGRKILFQRPARQLQILAETA